MNINNINSVGFTAKMPQITKFYVPGKNNTTLRCMTKGNIGNLSEIDYDVLKKGKVIETETYHNKRGFNDNRLACIYEKIQQKVRDGFDFMDELLDAQLEQICNKTK